MIAPFDVQSRWQRRAFVFAAPLVAAALFAPTLSFDFVGWDDGAYVTLNENLSNLDGLGRIWFSSNNEQYYPLTFTTYWIEHHLWGLNPAGYHAVNILLHMLNVILLGIILRSIGLSLAASAFVTLLFAVHPAQVMSVAWIAARKNLLSGAFIFSATIFWVKFRQDQRVRWSVAAIGLFCCALLSKTAVALIPLAWLCLDVSLFKIPARRAAVITAGLLSISGVAVATTWMFEQKFIGIMPGLGDRFLISTQAILFYVGRYFWPVGQSPIYGRWDTLSSGLGEVWAVSLVVAAVVLFLVARRRIAAIAQFGLVLSAVSIIPILGFVPYGNLLVSYVSDHYLYLPIAGVSIALATLIPRSWTGSTRARKTITCMAATVLIAFFVVSWQYLPVFRNARSVWVRTLEYGDSSYAAHAGLARLDVANKNWERAIHHLRRASDIEPERRAVRQSLAESYLMAGDVANARHEFGDLHAKYPDWARPLLGLATVAESSRDFESAIQLNQQAAELDSGNAAPHFALGRIFLGKNRRTDALFEFNAVLKLEPTNALAYVGLATCYRGMGDYRASISALERGLHSCPKHVAILNSLSRTLATAPDALARDGQRAVEIALQADRATGGKDLDVLDTLAASYAEAGDFATARETIHRAIKTALGRGDLAAVSTLESHLAIYQSSRPLRERSFRPLGRAP